MGLARNSPPDFYHSLLFVDSKKQPTSAVFGRLKLPSSAAGGLDREESDRVRLLGCYLLGRSPIFLFLKTHNEEDPQRH